MKKVLLKFGGTRVGDTMHVIPLLKLLKDNNIECDWVYGRYETDVPELLKELNLVEYLYPTPFIDGPINTDMNSIKRFLNFVDKSCVIGEDYDAIITPNFPRGIFESDKDLGIDLAQAPWAAPIIPNVTIDGWEKEGNYIACQPASISQFKTYRLLYNVRYPGDVKSFGFPGEMPIDDSISISDRSLVEVVEELRTCCMAVTTHSAIGVLSYYLGIPLIMIHFWAKNLSSFSTKDTVVELREPGLSELQDAIDKMYEENKL